MAKLPQKRQIWLFDDGRLGHLKQSQALLCALQKQSKTLQSMSIETIAVQLTRWQRWFAPRIAPGADRQLNNLPQKQPAIVIGTGSRCALYSRLIKNRYPDTFNIQILDPRTARQDFSLLIIPEHDQIEADNVISMRGSLVDISEPRKASITSLWPKGNQLKLAVLLAGDSDQNWALLQQAEKQSEANAVRTIISLAPRTKTRLCRAIEREWSGLSYRIISDTSGRQAYYHMLNTADQFWVAADSINQLSEVLTACGTRPVWIEATTHSERKKRWINEVLSKGEAQLLKNYPQQSLPTEIAASNRFWQQQMNAIAGQVICQWSAS